MHYIIWATDDNDNEVQHAAPVAESDAAYLQQIIEQLKPLSDADYMNGPAVILRTLAKSCYVICGEDVLWCTEWGPGLVVIRFSPSGEMAWAAIRSPVPNFGGREASEEELDAYDEDEDNPQYNLIFTPWDAQFDPQDREWHSFEPASKALREAFSRGLAGVNALADREAERSDNDDDRWREEALANLDSWCGEGIRLS